MTFLVLVMIDPKSQTILHAAKYAFLVTEPRSDMGLAFLNVKSLFSFSYSSSELARKLLGYI